MAGVHRHWIASDTTVPAVQGTPVLASMLVAASASGLSHAFSSPVQSGVSTALPRTRYGLPPGTVQLRLVTRFGPAVTMKLAPTNTCLAGIFALGPHANPSHVKISPDALGAVGDTGKVCRPTTTGAGKAPARSPLTLGSSGPGGPSGPVGPVGPSAPGAPSAPVGPGVPSAPVGPVTP
jgi:hypothetical protein